MGMRWSSFFFFLFPFASFFSLHISQNKPSKFDIGPTKISPSMCSLISRHLGCILSNPFECPLEQIRLSGVIRLLSVLSPSGKSILTFFFVPCAWAHVLKLPNSLRGRRTWPRIIGNASTSKYMLLLIGTSRKDVNGRVAQRLLVQ